MVHDLNEMNHKNRNLGLTRVEERKKKARRKLIRIHQIGGKTLEELRKIGGNKNTSER